MLVSRSDSPPNEVGRLQSGMVFAAGRLDFFDLMRPSLLPAARFRLSALQFRAAAFPHLLKMANELLLLIEQDLYFFKAAEILFGRAEIVSTKVQQYFFG